MSWGACSVSCGGGTRQRTRLCASPAPKHGGRQCEGNDVHIDFCNSEPCPSELSLKYTRQIHTACLSNANINRTRTEQQKTVLLLPLTVHGNWGPWSTWGSCSRTCNGGQMRRYRTCDNPRPANGGRSCAGTDTEIQKCSTLSCPGKTFKHKLLDTPCISQSLTRAVK